MDSSSLAKLQSEVQELRSETLKLALLHYTTFLDKEAASNKVDELLKPPAPAPSSPSLAPSPPSTPSLSTLVSDALETASSLSSSLPETLATLSSLADSHSSSRSCLLSLPPLLTLATAPSLLSNLIHNREHALALKLVEHMHHLQRTTLDSSGLPYELLTSLLSETVEGGKLEQLTEAITRELSTAPFGEPSAAGAPAPASHDYVDLIHLLERCYSLSLSVQASLHPPPSDAPLPPQPDVSLRLQLQFLRSRSDKMAQAIAPPDHVSRSLPLTPSQITDIIGTYRLCLFSIMTNYQVLFPTSPFPLISFASTSLDNFLLDAVPGYIASLPSLPLLAARDIVEAVSFLADSLSLLSMDLTFGRATLHPVYSQIIVDIVRYGPE
ncbi:hypothetical protein TeGR_g5940 [Tetraparma gracilis]|nr:hypothetical protein TeGR_g5940 [Tetraparma gracilis]